MRIFSALHPVPSFILPISTLCRSPSDRTELIKEKWEKERERMSNDHRFGLVCRPISWIDCSFSMKIITAASRKRPFLSFLLFLLCQSSILEQLNRCLSIYPCLLLFRLHARFSLSLYSSLSYLSHINRASLEKRAQRKRNQGHSMKEDLWSMTRSIDRSINWWADACRPRDNRSIWWDHFLFLSFSLSSRLFDAMWFVWTHMQRERENEQKNGNDSFARSFVLLLIIAVEVELNYHSISSSLSLSVSFALCRFTHGWQNEFDQPDALHHINSAISALIWLEQGWWWSARCWLILFLILQLSLSLPFAPNRFSWCARRCFSRIATNKTTIDWSAQITSHHFGISLFSRSDDASWRLPNHRFLSLRSQPIIVVRLLVIILWLWLTTESITHRSSCISSSIMFDEILQRQNIQTQESHFTSPLVTCFNEWRSTAHGHLRRSVESRRADRKTTLSSVRRHGRWLSITRVDVCGCINNTSTTNTPPTHRVSWFVSTFATALRWSQLMTREMHVCGSECRQT